MVRKRVFGTSFSIWDGGNKKKARWYAQKRQYLSKKISDILKQERHTP